MLRFLHSSDLHLARPSAPVPRGNHYHPREHGRCGRSRRRRRPRPAPQPGGDCIGRRPLAGGPSSYRRCLEQLGKDYRAVWTPRPGRALVWPVRRHAGPVPGSRSSADTSCQGESCRMAGATGRRESLEDPSCSRRFWRASAVLLDECIGKASDALAAAAPQGCNHGSRRSSSSAIIRSVISPKAGAAATPGGTPMSGHGDVLRDGRWRLFFQSSTRHGETLPVSDSRRRTNGTAAGEGFPHLQVYSALGTA